MDCQGRRWSVDEPPSVPRTLLSSVVPLAPILVPSSAPPQGTDGTDEYRNCYRAEARAVVAVRKLMIIAFKLHSRTTKSNCGSSSYANAHIVQTWI